MKRVPLVLLSITLALAIFIAGAYWGSYQFGKLFMDLNVQSYFEKTFVQELSMMGALRDLDSGNIEYARSNLKGFEDRMIISADLYREHFDDQSFQRACSVLQDINRYRNENTSKYAQRPDPIDPDISKILKKWEGLDCAAGDKQTS